MSLPTRPEIQTAVSSAIRAQLNLRTDPPPHESLATLGAYEDDPTHLEYAIEQALPHLDRGQLADRLSVSDTLTSITDRVYNLIGD